LKKQSYSSLKKHYIRYTVNNLDLFVVESHAKAQSDPAARCAEVRKNDKEKKQRGTKVTVGSGAGRNGGGCASAPARKCFDVGFHVGAFPHIPHPRGTPGRQQPRLTCQFQFSAPRRSAAHCCPWAPSALIWALFFGGWPTEVGK
jgi:hypothetical protein